jgi:hypothetical protein
MMLSCNVGFRVMVRMRGTPDVDDERDRVPLPAENNCRANTMRLWDSQAESRVRVGESVKAGLETGGGSAGSSGAASRAGARAMNRKDSAAVKRKSASPAV